MKGLGKFAIGVGLSATASFVWTLIPNSQSFESSSPLAFIEHYHWGLASMVVAKHVRKAKPYKQYLNGFGAGLIVVEAVGSQPFAIGKPPEQFYPSLALGAGLLVALLAKN